MYKLGDRRKAVGINIRCYGSHSEYSALVTVFPARTMHDVGARKLWLRLPH